MMLPAVHIAMSVVVSIQGDMTILIQRCLSCVWGDVRIGGRTLKLVISVAREVDLQDEAARKKYGDDPGDL